MNDARTDYPITFILAGRRHVAVDAEHYEAAMDELDGHRQRQTEWADISTKLQHLETVFNQFRDDLIRQIRLALTLIGRSLTTPVEYVRDGVTIRGHTTCVVGEMTPDGSFPVDVSYTTEKPYTSSQSPGLPTPQRGDVYSSMATGRLYQYVGPNPQWRPIGPPSDRV